MFALLLWCAGMPGQTAGRTPTNYTGAYAPGRPYAVGDIVTSPDGGTFLSAAPNNAGNSLLNKAFWTRLSPGGYGVNNPSLLGPPSGGDATRTTGAMAAGSSALTLASAASFVAGQGIFVSHAGAGCGRVRGTACPPGPTPTLTTIGRAGNQTYSYQTACIDGLGGSGVKGNAATVARGASQLSASDYNVLTLPVLPGCIEVAIYRNASLIGTQYAQANGSYTFADSGQPVVAAHRDIPPTPSANGLNDNLVGFITALQGTTATLSVSAGATVSGAAVFHSDTPLLQAAIAAGNVRGDANYRVNYPLNMLNAGGTYKFSALCDTGDVCVDATGQYNLTLRNVSLNAYGTLTQPSTIGLYCARNALHPTSQNLNSENVFIQVGGVGGTGHGSVGFYNFGCEIERHENMTLNAEQNVVLTGTNLWHVPSLFDPTQAPGITSMSAVTFNAPSGGTYGAFFTLDDTFSTNIFGGYMYGGDSKTDTAALSTYAFQLYSQNGTLYVEGFRSEGKSGAMHMNVGANLGGGVFDAIINHPNDPHLPMFALEDGSSINSMSILKGDDYGGSPFVVPFYGCVGPAARCSVIWSTLYVGVNQSFALNAAQTVGDHVLKVNGDSLETGSFYWANPVSLPRGTDLHKITSCGDYMVVAPVNGPPVLPGNNVAIKVMCTGNPLYVKQTAYDVNGATNLSYENTETVGAWSGWQQLARPGASGFTGTVKPGSCVTYSNGVATGVTSCGAP